jgi:hypothetical protein
MWETYIHTLYIHTHSQIHTHTHMHIYMQGKISHEDFADAMIGLNVGIDRNASRHIAQQVRFDIYIHIHTHVYIYIYTYIHT